MSAVLLDRHPAYRPLHERRAVTLGVVGGALGVVAGVVELTAGPLLRSWVGDKADTTRLGILTIALAAVGLASAWALLHRPPASAPRRLVLALGLLLPGAVCFTTVGRLWYLPGALLVAAGAIVAGGTWSERSTVAVAAERNWTALLVCVLAVIYVLLGATALGWAGVTGIAGGLGVLALVAMRGRIHIGLRVAVLLVATAPFAALTWWSVATPLTALLLLAFGAPLLARRDLDDRSEPGTARSTHAT